MYYYKIIYYKQFYYAEHFFSFFRDLAYRYMMASKQIIISLKAFFISIFFNSLEIS